MRACSLDRRAFKARLFTLQARLQSAPVHLTGALSRRACLPYRRAFKARLFALQTRAHARLLGEKARTHARVSPGRPRMWAHPPTLKPPKTLLRPPCLPCPKS
jgi:hypothetical protein